MKEDRNVRKGENKGEERGIEGTTEWKKRTYNEMNERER